MAQEGPPQVEQFMAHLFGALYWLLYHRVSRDLFPDTPVHALSVAQDQAVSTRTGAMIRNGAKQLLPPPPEAPDDQPRQ